MPKGRNGLYVGEVLFREWIMSPWVFEVAHVEFYIPVAPDCVCNTNAPVHFGFVFRQVDHVLEQVKSVRIVVVVRCSDPDEAGAALCGHDGWREV